MVGKGKDSAFLGAKTQKPKGKEKEDSKEHQPQEPKKRPKQTAQS